MENFTKEIVAALAQNNDLDEIFRFHLEKAINELIKNELAAYLGYENYDRDGFNTGYSRNGQYNRNFKNKYGELNLAVPRDINGNFSTKTIPKYQRKSDDLANSIILMYQNGITTREISKLIEKMYGSHYITQTISKINKVINENVKEFKQRKLESKYAAVYLDATFVPLRRGDVSKEAIYVAIGIKLNGNKEILDYTIASTELSMDGLNC